MNWRLLVLLFVTLAAGCDKNPNRPTPVDQTPPPLSTGGPSHTIIQVMAGSTPGTVTVIAWGNLKLMLARQPLWLNSPANGMFVSDSLSGGQLVVRDYSCGSRSTGRGSYANYTPRDNSDSTIVKDLPVCGNRVDLEIWVETFYVSQGKEQPIQHTLAPPTEIRGNNLRVQNQRIVGNL